MPRQCISKRNKNIKEREKTYNPVTFLQKSANQQQQPTLEEIRGPWMQDKD